MLVTALPRRAFVCADEVDTYPDQRERDPIALTRVVIFVAIVMAFLTTPARADDALATFFAQVFAQPLPPQPGIIKPLRRAARERAQATQLADGDVHDLIVSSVTARLGPQWVPTALHIAHVESRGRCAAYNRGAIGVFQVRHPEQFGVSAAAARTCSGGVAAGIAHMASCLSRGATTSASMMRCHNSGSPFGRVERAYRVVLG